MHCLLWSAVAKDSACMLASVVKLAHVHCCSAIRWHRHRIRCHTARALQIEGAQYAHLCTNMSHMHHRRAGYPFGMLIDFASDGAGYPIFCLSPLSIHSHNIHEDPRCSLVVQVRSRRMPTGLQHAFALANDSGICSAHQCGIHERLHLTAPTRFALVASCHILIAYRCQGGWG